mmetsp:Transcript_28588/g.50651  ORF Transcript_28588/g.50651 Transcript_28588/m.50651 type:complete len:87 (-) Transcript_28588:22-282(-)
MDDCCLREHFVMANLLRDRPFRIRKRNPKETFYCTVLPSQSMEGRWWGIFRNKSCACGKINCFIGSRQYKNGRGEFNILRTYIGDS